MESAKLSTRLNDEVEWVRVNAEKDRI